MEMQIAKIMKTRNGKYAVFKIDPETGLAKQLAYQKWFIEEKTAQKYKEQYIKKMLTCNT